MALAEGDHFAEYMILRFLGSGGMGEVYLVQHPRLPRREALKVLPVEFSADREFRERFNREAELAAALWHPHIVAVHDRGEFNGQLWIAMDYVEGTDVAVLLHHHHPGGMPPRMALEIISAVAGALDYAHEQGLLHRDVKPGNILLAHPESTNQRTMLADFGIARRVDDRGGLTAANMTVGTVAYSAPEQLLAEDIDGRADQYALAATAFHLLSGAPPFVHDNPAVVMSRHLTAQPPPISDQRPDLSDLDPVLDRALSKQAKDRFDSCLDFAQALNAQMGEAGLAPATAAAPIAEASAPTEHALARPKRPWWARPGVIIAVLAVLLVGALAFAVREYLQATEEKDELRRTAPSPSSSASTAPAASRPVAIGAYCSQPDSTAKTAGGEDAYCSLLQDTDKYLWSRNQGTIPSPTVVPTEAEEPGEDVLPVLVCMEETGQTRRDCRTAIRESSESADTPPA